MIEYQVARYVFCNWFVEVKYAFGREIPKVGNTFQVFSVFSLHSNRLKTLKEGHGLKRYFNNGRRKTTTLIGLFLMTSSKTDYSAAPIDWQPL